jgi:hypothetical protein
MHRKFWPRKSVGLGKNVNFCSDFKLLEKSKMHEVKARENVRKFVAWYFQFFSLSDFFAKTVFL